MSILKSLSQDEIAELQKAVDSLTTVKEFNELQVLVNGMCDWCDVRQPCWSYDQRVSDEACKLVGAKVKLAA